MTAPGVDLRALSGRVIDGRYLLRDWIDDGGFGAVFAAEQRMLGVRVRKVAVKVSRQDGLSEETAQEQFADALVLARAMDEMIDAEALRHLVPVYDAGVAQEVGGRAYLAMELVRGRSLDAEFRSHPRGVPVELMLRWAREICVALRGIHALVPPLVHRDLKPSNVLLSRPGPTVRLVDFGLAGRLIEQGYAPGVAGTLAYMAPETMQGKSLPASDCYSVGILLYEGLTGRHPFEHLVPPADLPRELEHEWVGHARHDCVVEPPSAHSGSLTPAIDAVVLRCLRTAPGERFRTATDLLEALDEAVRAPSPSSLSAPESPAERFARLRERADRLTRSGEHGPAARVLHEAHALAERHPTLLPSRRERADLAGQVADAYARDDNDFQAARFRRRRDDELNGGGR
ncbi:serine/threonine-protein kinase [Actinomadura sp. 9N215]|uniref:serine/threonine-protein kinase n=1 Tax=Actinomadura sp. 9N215 TaxID=3375150 RepID=UPI0037AB5ED3